MINSHYISQFILRQFSNNNRINYCDLHNKKTETRNIKSIFSENEYYPEELERSLCRNIEVQFSTLLNAKILTNTKNLILTLDEMLILKKYLLITVFRFKPNIRYLQELYPDLSLKEFDEILGEFTENLNKILECKTKEEMNVYIDLMNEHTNPNLFAYVKDITSSYTVIVSSRRCEEDFVIHDKGFVSYEGPIKIKKLNATLELAIKTGDRLLFQIASMLTPHDYSVFPLTRNIAILTMSPFFKLCLDKSPYHIKYPEEAQTISKILGFGNKEIIEDPKIVSLGDSGMGYKINIKHLKLDDVIFINTLLISATEQFFAFSDINKIQRTIEQNIGDVDLSFLLKDEM